MDMVIGKKLNQWCEEEELLKRLIKKVRNLDLSEDNFEQLKEDRYYRIEVDEKTKVVWFIEVCS